jgi:4-alpha-glucanotransferase
VASAELRELARLYGIQLTYEDAAGKKQSASRDAVVAILRSRARTNDLQRALRERRAQAAARVLEPVIVAWGRRRPQFELRLPREADSVAYEVQLESGDVLAGRIGLAGGLQRVTLPHRLPHGYHTLRIDDAHEAALFAAPVQAYEPLGRSWGIFLPLYATRGATLGELERYQQWIGSLGGRIVATLPLLAAFDDEPSPYSPVSRLYWNERYLDVDKLPEYDGTTRDLHALAARFAPDDAFEAFAPDATDYARFRGDERYHLYVQYRMRQQLEQAKHLYLDFPLGVHPKGYDVHRFGEQFAPAVAVGAPPDSFFTKGQNWGFPPLDPDAIRADRYAYFRRCVRTHMQHAAVLRIDHVMGLHRLFWIPDGAEAKDGIYVRYPDEELYAVLMIESHRHRCAIVGEDLGTVPQYVPRMMEKHGLRRMYVVQYEVKDADPPLASPPAASIASINTHDMPTFAGFWQGRDIDDRLQQTLLDDAGAEEERRRREAMKSSLIRLLRAQSLLPDEANDTVAILDAVLGYLSGSDADVVLVNLEDLWLETEPQNVPGVPERSWRQKLKLSLDEARNDPTVDRLLRRVDERRRKANGHTQ